MTQSFLVRLITTALATAVFAGTWDVWWHSAIGRDTFWEPPHLLLYTSVVIAISAGVYGWYTTRDKVWRNLAIVLLLVPIAGPFDEWWHQIFGIEILSSPLIIWSPPHVAIALSITASFILLLPLLSREEDVAARQFFGALNFASATSMLFFLTIPLEPTGAYHVLGFAGAGIPAAILVLAFMTARNWMPGIAGSTLVAMLFLLLQSVSSTSKMLPEAGIPPHDHPPRWLFMFATLLTSVFIDVGNKKRPPWLTAMIAAGLWSSVLFGFTANFLEPQFRYGATNMWTAIVSSIVSGFLAGIVLTLVPRFPSVTRSIV